EFDSVFLVGLTEGIFPSARALEDRKTEALEEERRLCFVGVTRAKKHLYLTESEGFGVKGFSKVPSRFLFDIDPKYLEIIGEIPDEIKEQSAVQVRAFDKITEVIYKVGDQMMHKVFGEGVIEVVDEKTKTYMIRFVNGIKPISFNYGGLSHIF
ncbi:MAG TPA: 3'-5' exonuclease, partial [Oscillospiraceae bacterium]|nr:3'-5' exonuclease [Oscillospiraceae bacterium]